MWNPVPETWIKAIEAGFFATWPGLTAQLVKKHLTRTIETDLGHLRADRKNVRSTKQKHDGALATNPTRTRECYIKNIELKGKLYTDQTGHFPVTSSKGNKHVMVAYNHDSNAILARAIKTK